MLSKPTKRIVLAAQIVRQYALMLVFRFIVKKFFDMEEMKLLLTLQYVVDVTVTSDIPSHRSLKFLRRFPH